MTNAQAAVLACAHSIQWNSSSGLERAAKVKEWLDEQDRLDVVACGVHGPGVSAITIGPCILLKKEPHEQHLDEKGQLWFGGK